MDRSQPPEPRLPKLVQFLLPARGGQVVVRRRLAREAEPAVMSAAAS